MTAPFEFHGILRMSRKTADLGKVVVACMRVDGKVHRMGGTRFARDTDRVMPVEEEGEAVVMRR